MVPYPSGAPYCGLLQRSTLQYPTLVKHLIVFYPCGAPYCMYPCQVERLILHFPSGAPQSTFLSVAPYGPIPYWSSLCYPTQLQHYIVPYPHKWSTLLCPILAEHPKGHFLSGLHSCNIAVCPTQAGHLILTQPSGALYRSLPKR